MPEVVEINEAGIKFIYENSLKFTSQFTDYGKALLNSCFLYAIEDGADHPHKVVVAGRQGLLWGLENMGNLAPKDGADIVQRISVEPESDPGAHFYAMLLLLGRSPDRAIADCLAELSATAR